MTFRPTEDGFSGIFTRFSWIFIWVCLKMLCKPLNPMVLLIIIPIKWLFHWEPYFQTNPYVFMDFHGVSDFDV